MRILVVDDEQPLRQMMRLTLEAAGYEVGEADDGAQALDAWRRLGPWDAVLLDQRLPGMDGLEVLQRLREADPTACVVMVTAYASIDLAVEAMKARRHRLPAQAHDAGDAARRGGGRAGPAHGGAGRRASRAPIETLTMNGYSIVRAGATEEGHRYRVRRYPSGTETEVVVAIGPEALALVQRLTLRSLPPEGGFWAVQAERALANHLWREGQPPASGRLEVTDVSREDLDVASAWKSD